VGSSSVVNYRGSGAYFLDKVEEGVWRLEVMPDAVYIRDPFERASPKKEVTRIQWTTNPMKVSLPDLGDGFGIQGLNDGNTFTASSSSEGFQVKPGTYLLARNGKTISPGKNNVGVIGLREFVAPASFSKELFLQHEPFTEVTPGKSFIISARVAGIDTGRVSIQVSRLGGGGGGGGGGGQPRIIAMTRKTASDFEAEIPADLLTPGILTYRIILQQGNDYAVFPGNIKSNPFAWDSYNNETYKTFVAAENGRMEIFNATTDRTARIYPGFRRGFQSGYITGEMPGQLILRISTTELSGDHVIGFQHFFADKLKGRITEVNSLEKLVIRARAAGTQPVKAKVTLTNANVESASCYVTLTGSFSDIVVPLNELKADSALLLPRPYPGFQSLWFKGSGSAATFRVQDAEKIEITIGSDIPATEFNKPYSLEVISAWFQK
jgi:hypothetical protein